MARQLRLPPWVDAVDEAVDRRWEPLRGRPLPDAVFYAASNAAEFSAIWHALGALGALGGRSGRRRAVRLSLTMAAESVLVNGVVKSLFNRVRPSRVDDHERPHHLRQPRTSSFPSGHASAAFTAAALLTESRPVPVRIAVRLSASVVALSRVHVRIHHASDVVAGAALGMLLGRIARALWGRVDQPERRE